MRYLLTGLGHLSATYFRVATRSESPANPLRASGTPRPANAGFTLIELLVVIAIIAMLAGLILPAVHKARERGRQADCKSKLHQFSLSVRMYIDDHKEYPKWLSCLHPASVPQTELYVCKSDQSMGAQGSKPDGSTEVGSQYAETDDTATNPNGSDYRGRNATIQRCSYLYEFCNARCSWFYDDPGYLGVSSPDDVDTDKDGTVSWSEAKEQQLKYGDTTQTNGRHAYDQTVFPIIRCFHHCKERQFTVNHPTDGQLKQGLTINVAYNGNIVELPLMWELKPIE